MLPADICTLVPHLAALAPAPASPPLSRPRCSLKYLCVLYALLRKAWDFHSAASSRTSAAGSSVPALDAVVASSRLDVLRSRAANIDVTQAALVGLKLTVALEEFVRDSNVYFILPVAFSVKMSLYVLLRLGSTSRASIIASNNALRLSSSSR
jgi:hypothetical protein